MYSFMRTVYRIGLISVLVLCGCSLYAQAIDFEPVYYNITTEQGLPSMETYSVKQDSHGYIWICTDAGVCRYDGYEFKVFTTKDGLTDNVVFDTHEDHEGRIWFLTYNSMLCYWDGYKMTRFKYNGQISKHLNGRKSNKKSLLVCKDGMIYYNLGLSGLIEIDTNGKLRELTDQLGTVSIFDVGESIFPGLAASGVRGFPLDIVDRRNPSKPKIIGKTESALSYFGVGIDNHAMSQRYVFMFNDVYDLKTSKRVFSGSSLISLSIKDSLFWAGEIGSGVTFGRIRDGQFIPKTRLLKECSVTGVLMDHQQGIWLSTIERGVFYIKDLDLQRAILHGDEDNEDFITVLGWRNDIFISTQQFMLNTTTGEYFMRGKMDNRIPYYGILNEYYIRQGQRENQLMLREINVAYRRLYQEPGGKGYMPLDHVLYTQWDEWDENAFSHKYFQEHNVNMRSNKVCVQGTAIFGNFGTNLIRIADKELTSIPIVDEHGEGIIINDLYPLKEEAILIATSNNGLIMRYTDGRLKTIDESKGLLSNKVSCVRTLKDGNILVGSPVGLTVLDEKGEVLTYFTNNSSYRGLSVNMIYVKDDWVYLATKTGLMRIHQNQFKAKQNLQLYDVSLKDVWIDEAQQKITDTIYFPDDARLLKVDFNVFQFANWMSKKYQYRFGENGNWIDLTSPSINLYRPSGEFDMEIRYMDADFRWSNPIFLCHVSVLVPFWQQWYFWSALTLLFLGVLFLLYRRRQLQVNTRLLQENQMLMLEQQMQNARMNPHFIFNVLNSIHSFVIHEERDQAELYLMKFSRLMREILTQTRDGVSTIGEECSLLEKYLELEQLRHRSSFEYLVQAPLELKKRVIPSMLIQPFAENAVLHGLKGRKGGVLRITFSKESEQEVEVTISDNGRMSDDQFEKLQQSGDKNAFGITKLRLEKYNRLKQTKNYGITIQRSDEGTSIRITIPILEDLNER